MPGLVQMSMKPGIDVNAFRASEIDGKDGGKFGQALPPQQRLNRFFGPALPREGLFFCLGEEKRWNKGGQGREKPAEGSGLSDLKGLLLAPDEEIWYNKTKYRSFGAVSKGLKEGER